MREPSRKLTGGVEAQLRTLACWPSRLRECRHAQLGFTPAVVEDAKAA